MSNQYLLLSLVFICSFCMNSEEYLTEVDLLNIQNPVQGDEEISRAFADKIFLVDKIPEAFTLSSHLLKDAEKNRYIQLVLQYNSDYFILLHDFVSKEIKDIHYIASGNLTLETGPVLINDDLWSWDLLTFVDGPFQGNKNENIEFLFVSNLESLQIEEILFETAILYAEE